MSLYYPSLKVGHLMNNCIGQVRTFNDFILVLWNESLKGCLWDGKFRTLMVPRDDLYMSRAQKQPKNRFLSPSKKYKIIIYLSISIWFSCRFILVKLLEILLLYLVKLFKQIIMIKSETIWTKNHTFKLLVTSCKCASFIN